MPSGENRGCEAPRSVGGEQPRIAAPVGRHDPEAAFVPLAVAVRLGRYVDEALPVRRELHVGQTRDAIPVVGPHALRGRGGGEDGRERCDGDDATNDAVHDALRY